MRVVAPLWTIAVCLTLASLPSISLAKKDGAKVELTKFDDVLDSVFYFDDSNTLLGLDVGDQVVMRSEDAGATWKRVDIKGDTEGVWALESHPWDNQRAYIIGMAQTHWMTTDQGKTWKTFETQSEPPLGRRSPISFHARDPKKVIWNGELCTSFFSCDQISEVSDDDFKSTEILGRAMRSCNWATSTPIFAKEIAEEVDNRIVCIKRGLASSSFEDNRLVVSDDYFKKQEVEPLLENGRVVPGIISMAHVKKYIVAAAKGKGSDELALYVTDDSSTWHRAEFGQHRIEEHAYTILESTNYSMEVDVMGSSRMFNPMGYLFTSNSNGTYFTRNIDHTNRNQYGGVDFKKVTNIQGIVLVNTVKNHKEVEQDAKKQKQIISKISFNDGRDFEDLTVDDEDLAVDSKKQLHLHSVTDAQHLNRIFSSPAPGIVMGVGNTGDYLKKPDAGNLYVSDDAGLTWRKALDGPHMYEFGNYGAVLVAIATEETKGTDYIQYSLNHGKDWEKVKLDEKIFPEFLTTAPDSTTLKFLFGGIPTDSEDGWYVYKLDLSDIHERKCEDRDFDPKWSARVDKNGKPTCLMGHKQFYRRRKADAKCVVDDEFRDPVPEFERCDCTDADFECDFNFIRSEDRKECKPAGPLAPPKGKCKSPDDKFMGSSGWRLIPGNDCKRGSGNQKDDQIERPCSQATIKPPADNKISHQRYDFRTGNFGQRHYIQRTGSSDKHDETVVATTISDRGHTTKVYISYDHGKKWTEILEDDSVKYFQPNPFNFDSLYFVTSKDTVHYTINRGATFDSFEAPSPRKNDVSWPMSFHPDNKDWILWTGQARQKQYSDVYVTKDRGARWEKLARYAERCQFISRGENDKLILCEQYEDENPEKNLQLIAKKDMDSAAVVKFENILHFATMSEFILVAAKTDDGSLSLHVSVDGETFAAARFPKNIKVKQMAYDVLDSSTHAVFVHVTVGGAVDNTYGSIIKSNSNGTSYVSVIDNVNQDDQGYVDFEKMIGLEGVAMVNVVANAAELGDATKKKLKSMITHNDGAEWAWIPPPKSDADKKNYNCVKNADEATEHCSLHLHSYTERRDKSTTFSSSSAIGLMMAVGNVGEYLEARGSDNTDTFLTRDAGITWRSVKKGSFLYEYGDRGSIIVIVSDQKPTKSVFYTLDEGDTWQEYSFSDVAVSIFSITTIPTDDSFNFLLWGHEEDKTSQLSINIDFSDLKARERQCKLDEAAPEADDYFLWSPKHPSQDNDCLFGHVTKYHRKRPDAECRNGQNLERLHSISENCACTRQDFECDYNFQARSDGTCALVEGLSPPDHEQRCKENPDQKEFWDVSGFRKIPLSTCEGGLELDHRQSKACPGHEEEYNRKHGISGTGLFFAVVLPVLAAGGAGYWVWKRYNERGFGSFGQIRLGESISSTGSKDSPFITIPVAIISGVVAVAKALPLLVSSLLRSAKGYMPLNSGSSGRSRGLFGRGGASGGASGGPYRSRDSFATRTNAYDDVDDELLGAVDDDADADEV